MAAGVSSSQRVSARWRVNPRASLNSPMMVSIRLRSAEKGCRTDNGAAGRYAQREHCRLGEPRHGLPSVKAMDHAPEREGRPSSAA